MSEYGLYDGIIYKNAQHIINKYKTNDDIRNFYIYLKYFDTRNNIVICVVVIMFLLLILFGRFQVNNYELVALLSFIVILGCLDYVIINFSTFIKGYNHTSYRFMHNIKKYLNENYNKNYKLDTKIFNMATIDMDKYYKNFKGWGYEPYSLIASTISRWWSNK